MASKEGMTGASYYQAFLDLLASDTDDKHIARKMECSRGEVKRRRLYFTKQEVLKEDGTLDEKKRDAWLASEAGVKAQQKWEGQVQKKQNQKMPTAFQQQEHQRPTLKRAWSLRKV
ncbi:MAG: hypothetical protein O2954_06970 [bacterium]|nr:hypothetical protein [bacterium]